MTNDVKKFYNVTFIKFDILKFTEDLLVKVNEFTLQLHPIYKSKTLRLSMEKVIDLYTECFLEGTSRFRNLGEKNLLVKINRDYQHFETFFRNFINDYHMSYKLQFFDEIINFFTCRPENINSPCFILTQILEHRFNEKIAMDLLQVRTLNYEDQSLAILRIKKAFSESKNKWLGIKKNLVAGVLNQHSKKLVTETNPILPKNEYIHIDSDISDDEHELNFLPFMTPQESYYVFLKHFQSNLLKLDTGLVKICWKKRFYVIQGEALLEYRTQHSDNLITLIKIVKIENIMDLDIKQFEFEYEKKKFIFEAESQIVKWKWVNKLREVHFKLLQMTPGIS